MSQHLNLRWAHSPWTISFRSRIEQFEVQKTKSLGINRGISHQIFTRDIKFKIYIVAVVNNDWAYACRCHVTPEILMVMSWVISSSFRCYFTVFVGLLCLIGVLVYDAGRWIKRYWIDVPQGKGSEYPTGLDFSFMSYNVLAQSLLEQHSDMYHHCKPEFLTWEYRRSKLIEEFKYYRPDVSTPNWKVPPVWGRIHKG
jgi:hypothetical protein